MIDTVLKQLKQIIENKTKDYDELLYEVNSNGINVFAEGKDVLKIISLPEGSEAVIWTVLDFKHKAMELEGLLWEQVYDESLFNKALTEMIKKNDCNNGINWDTVNFYLNEYCKKTN